MSVYAALMSSGEARARGLLDEPWRFDFELPDSLADMVSRLRTRQAAKDCYDR